MDANSGFYRITRDLLDLCELQMQLISVDSKEARRQAIRGTAYGVAAVTLLGSGLTTALVASGFVLHDLAGWTVGASLLTTACLTFMIVAVLLLFTWRSVKEAASAMSETKSEFAENLKWIKAVLVSPGTLPRNQIRSETFTHESLAAGQRFSTENHPNRK